MILATLSSPFYNVIGVNNTEVNITVVETGEVVEAGGKYAFRVHSPGGYWRPDESPHLTIQKRGDISINNTAFEGLGRPTAVELLYDPDSLAVGMRSADPDSVTAVKLRPSKARQNANVLPGSSFVNRNGLADYAGKRYPARVVDGILVADLKDGVKTSGGRPPREA